MKKKRLLHNVLTLASFAPVLLQSFLPAISLFITPSQVFADDATQSATASDQTTTTTKITTTTDTSTPSGTDTKPTDSTTPPDPTTTTETSTTQEATPAANTNDTINSNKDETVVATESGTQATDSAKVEASPSAEAKPEEPSTDANQTNAPNGDNKPSDSNTNNSNTNSTDTSISTGTVAGDQTTNTASENKHGSLSTEIVLPSPVVLPIVSLLSTNKADYSPTDTAIITGSGFDANKVLTLEITSSDQPPVDFTTTVLTNATGSFTYSYQLDGNYRPNYTVYVKDGSGNIVATTTFTDSNKVGSVAVGIQVGSLVSGSAGSATYSITVNRNGTGAFDVNLSITTSLPTGVAKSFNPSSLSFSSSDDSKTSTLTLTSTNLTPAGSTSFTVKADKGGGDFATDTGTLLISIAKTNPVITFGTAPAPTYLGGNFAVSATTTNTDSSSLIYSAVSGPCVLVSGATFSSSGAGTCVVQADGAETANFNAAYASQSVSIAKANQTPTSTVTGLPASATYGQAGVTAGTSGGSGSGAVSFSAGASSACSVNSSTGAVTITAGTGTCSITATKVADSNYNETTSAPVSITIDKANQAALTAVATPSTVPYGTTSTLSSTGGSGTGAVTFSVGSSTGCNITGGTTLNVSDVSGSCSVTATKAADGNYNLATSATLPITLQKVTQATLTVTAPTSVTYGSTGQITTSGGSGTGAMSYSHGASTGCTVDSSTGVITVTNASNTCTVTATKAADGNYNVATSVGFSVTLNKATSTTVVTCPASAVYTGSSLTPCTVLVTGAGGLSLTPSAVHTSNTNVGTASASYTFAGDANHSSSSDSKNFDITPAGSTTVVTFEVGPYTYRGSAFTATANVTGVGGLYESVTVVYSGDCTNVTATDGCTATATYSGDANHNDNTDSKSVTITKAPLGITSNDTSKNYGSTVTFTGTEFTRSDLYGEGDTLTSVTLSSTGAVGTAGVGSYDITGSSPVGTGLTNYDIHFNVGILTVNKANATIAVTPYNVTYNGNPHTATGTATGVESPTPVDLTSLLNLSGTTHTSAGDYIGDTWTFAGNSNYNNDSGTVDNNINKADQAITVTTHAPASAANGSSFTVAATGGGSGNLVTYTSGTPSVCTNVGATFTMNSNTTGTCAVQYDQAGNSNYNAATQVTESTETLLTISSEATSSVTSTSTTITWTTDHDATSRVVYDTVSHLVLGAAPNYGYASSTDTFDTDPKLLSHSVGLTGLSSGTTYYYRTISHGSPEAVSAENSFTTTSPAVAGASTSDSGSTGGGPYAAPVCNETKPGSAPTLTSAVAGTNSVTLSWTAASDPVTYYLVTYGTSSGAQTYGNPNVGGKGTTSYTVSGLSGGTTYYFKVRAGNGCAPGDYSNEVSATPGGGVVQGPAAGFAQGVLGASKSATEAGQTLGEATPAAEVVNLTDQNKPGFSKKTLAVIGGGLLVLIAAYLLYRHKRKKV